MFTKIHLLAVQVLIGSTLQAGQITADWTVRSAVISFKTENKDKALNLCTIELNKLVSQAKNANLNIKKAGCDTKVDGYETEDLDGGLIVATVTVEAEKETVCNAFPQVICY